MSSSGIQRWAVVATVAALSGCAVAADDGGTGMPDSGAQIDTGNSLPDTDVADTGTKPDTSVPDTGTKPDTSVADTATAPDTSVTDTFNPDAKHDGEGCADATKITFTAAGASLLVGETSRGYAENTAAGGTACRLGSGGDHVYEMLVPAGKKATVKVTPTDGSFDPVVNLVAGPASACGASGSCVVGGVDAANGALAETISWSNATGADATVFVVVDSLTSGTTAQGVYDLDAKLTDSSFGDTCAAAKTIAVTGTTPTVLSGETLTDYVSDYGTGTNCSGASGPDHLYKVDVPPSSRLTATVKPLSVPAAWDPSLNLQTTASCGVTPRVCISGTDVGGSGASETLKYTNITATTQTIYVVVETYSSVTTTLRDYDLTLQLAPIPTNDGCATPIAITVPPGSVTGDTTAASSDYTGGTNCAGTAGNDLVYSVDVPAGKQLAATILGTSSGFAPALDVVDSAWCGAAGTRSCLASVLTTTASPAGTARWTNAGTTTKKVLLVVDSTSTAGAFSLSVAFTDPPMGDTCANAFATLVPDGMTVVSGTTAGATNDYGTGSGCGAAAGPDTVYTVTIPPGKVLATTVLGSAFAPSISYQSGAQCSSAPRVCSGSLTTTTGSPTGTLRYANESSSASETINVVVDSATAAGGGYSLSASLTDTKAGEICGKAEPIVAGSNVTGLTTTGYTNEYEGGSGCKATTGPDRVFSVVVPDGKQLTALVTPGTSFDPTISLVAGTPATCAAHVCDAAVDTKTAGQPEVATYKNFTGAPQTVFIIVDSTSATNPAGDFSLLTTLVDAPLTYAGGETCADAPLLKTSATPLVFNDDLSLAIDDYTYPGDATCQYHSDADLAYKVSIPAGQTLDVSVTNTTSDTYYVNLVIGTAADCGTNLPCAANTSGSTGGANLSYANTSGVAQTGFIIVDSLVASGAYTVSVTVH